VTIELPKEARDRAVQSIERWFRENRDERIGNIAAGALLGYLLEEIGPSLYNQAIARAQERMQERIAELDIELHEDEFGYWRKFDAAKPRGR
jgi:uncharacterized protein (DUF2164 family)